MSLPCIGMSFGVIPGEDQELAILLESIRSAEAEGFRTAWIANVFAFDALTVAALAGRETSRIELGTAVVPTHSRHPFAMAQQALTANAAAQGRFLLGIGPSHQVMVEAILGLSFEKPARHVREYLEVVRALVETGKVGFEGATYRVNGALRVPGAKPFPILIAGLGPVMRRLAGTLADGTITWMAGTRTIGEVLAPAIREAAERAGRPSPRIVCSLPIALTEDAAGAREATAKRLVMYGQLPSYRAMLDEERAAGPADVAILGDERELERALVDLAGAGVTDFVAAIVPHGDEPDAAVRRTREFLAALERRRAS